MLAEEAYREPLPDFTPTVPSPEVLVPRLGEYLVDQGFITSAKLQAGLKRQKELASVGENLMLGQTLVHMGLVDREVLDQVVTQQIVELHTALKEANRTLEQRVEERTAELRRALERLTEISQLKANLISNISHELRTPLAHIKGYVELIAEGRLGSLSTEMEKAIEVIHRASQRLGRLIEDLIEFSTASREGLRLDLQQVSIYELADNTMQRSQEKAEKAGVTIKVELEKDLPALYADPERLAWVLYQLFDNGIKFTPSGGQVIFSAKKENRQVLLSINDTGIGIPSDRMLEIFEPFHQLDGSATRRYGGTGLGLSLAKMILEAHESKISIESEEGKGSTFSFPIQIATGDK
jgi:signal transduction histidine kinase